MFSGWRSFSQNYLLEDSLVIIDIYHNIVIFLWIRYLWFEFEIEIIIGIWTHFLFVTKASVFQLADIIMSQKWFYLIMSYSLIYRASKLLHTLFTFSFLFFPFFFSYQILRTNLWFVLFNHDLKTAYCFKMSKPSIGWEIIQSKKK